MCKYARYWFSYYIPISLKFLCILNKQYFVSAYVEEGSCKVQMFKILWLEFFLLKMNFLNVEILL